MMRLFACLWSFQKFKGMKLRALMKVFAVATMALPVGAAGVLAETTADSLATTPNLEEIGYLLNPTSGGTVLMIAPTEDLEEAILKAARNNGTYAATLTSGTGGNVTLITVKVDNWPYQRTFFINNAVIGEMAKTTAGMWGVVHEALNAAANTMGVDQVLATTEGRLFLCYGSAGFDIATMVFAMKAMTRPVPQHGTTFAKAVMTHVANKTSG
jgi:hypothetical protein